MILWLTVLNALLTLSTFFIPTPGLFATFVLFNGATQAAAGAYFQTSAIAVASLFGPSAVQAMMSGQAAVAVAVSGVQVVSSYSSLRGKPKTYAGDGSAEEMSAFVFFMLSTVFLFCTYLAHEYMVRMPLYTRVAGVLEETSKISLGSDDGHRRSVSRARSEVIEETGTVLRIAKANLNYELAVAGVFMITLVSGQLLLGLPPADLRDQSVYPPITLSIGPVNPDTHPLLFSAIHFLVFNTGDFIGRYTCSFPSLMIWSGTRLLFLSISRVLFIPLFLLCNVRSATVEPTTPAINSDLAFFLILFFFGWSNGHISSACMMAAPSVDHNPKLRGRTADIDVAATVASFCLVAGLVLGSISSFAVRSAICNCNPFTG